MTPFTVVLAQEPEAQQYTLLELVGSTVNKINISQYIVAAGAKWVREEEAKLTKDNPDADVLAHLRSRLASAQEEWTDKNYNYEARALKQRICELEPGPDTVLAPTPPTTRARGLPAGIEAGSEATIAPRRLLMGNTGVRYVSRATRQGRPTRYWASCAGQPD